jgi:hypothetical protein
MNSCAWACCGSAFDLLACGVGLAVGDVLGDRAHKQHRVLRHDANLRAQALQRRIADVAPVQPNDPLLRLVKAQQQVYQRAFARARMPHQRDHLAWLNLERHLAQRLLARRVAERDALELDAPLQGGQWLGVGRVVGFWLDIECLAEDALRSGAHLLARELNRADARRRLRNLVQQEQETEQLGGGHLPTRDLLPAEPQHERDARRADELDRRAQPRASPLTAQRMAQHLAIAPDEPLDLAVFRREGLDDPHA